MGVAKKKFKPYKPKPKPKPKIDYPPVPTKKWIPPDRRKKPPKPEPKYIKPEGITQKLAISTLKKVWNKYDVIGDAAILTGNFSQFHKRFSFKTNGYQGACNSAVACVYSQLYKMASWTKSRLDQILITGDDIYVRSTQQGDRCLIEVPPEKIHTSFFLGHHKITLFVSPNTRVTEELTSISEDKAKEIMVQALEKFFSKAESGIFYIHEKYAAVWVREAVYYFFDPGEHNWYGEPWTGVPGNGVSFLGRFKKLTTLAEFLFKNFPSAKEPYAKFHIMACGIARIVNIDITPPENFEDLAPHEQAATQIIEDNVPPPVNHKMEALKEYVEEARTLPDPILIKVQEISPDVTDDLSPSRRPSWLQEGPINKEDFCRYPVPIPSYLKGEHAKLTYYTELIPNKMGILRGNTCQTNPNFSKYGGRQSMGNAMSALIMLRFCKSKLWVPKIVDTILENGDRLYKDAMVTIPRTHSLRLSNFPLKIEYEGRKFTPEIQEYALVGQLQTQDYDILDLEPALEEFLADNDCCIILGPQILAVWVEDGIYYVFDPNERDLQGKAIVKAAYVGANLVNLNPPGGVGCVIWCQDLKDLVSLYIGNTEKPRRGDRFYLSRVNVRDYVEVSDDWNNFKGVCIGKWIIRGTFNQGSFRFSEESRNTQGTANALMALAMQSLVGVQEWTSDIVDEILMLGDKFYKSSVEYLHEKEQFNDPKLMLSELKNAFLIRDKEADFELDECVTNGIIYAKSENDLADLKKGLEYFFIDNDTGVLTTREISVAIWKKDEVYYYLDPYSRDNKGLCTGYGTSCALRILCLEDLAKSIEANLDPKTEDFFNITNVKVTLYEAGTEGGVKPPLNNYTKLDEKSAILRSWLSEKDDKYEVRKGRQTVPMCLSAVGFNKLKPSTEWTKNDLDEILDKGDVLYVESMAKAQGETTEANEEELPTEENEDARAGGDSKQNKLEDSKSQKSQKSQKSDQATERVAKEEGEEETVPEEVDEEEEEEVEEPEVELVISSDNVITVFNVGPNNFSVEFVDIAEGNIKESLKDSIRSFFEQEQTDDNFNQEALLETNHYTVALWRDDRALYVFDSRPRDKNGQVIGKEDWDPEPPEPEEEPEEVEESGQDEKEEDTEPQENIDEEGEEDTEAEDLEVTEPVEQNTPEVRAGGEGEGEGKDEEELEQKVKDGDEEGADETVEDEKKEVRVESEPPPKPKKSPSYWTEQEKSGRACTTWFVNLDDLVNFLYENIPTKDRLKKDFRLRGVTITNTLKVKSKFNPDDKRNDVYDGDWYDFKEVEHGKWIIRATLDLTHELFPECNRGNQTVTASLIALALAHIYEMTCFVCSVPDSILVYGDKLYTFIKRSRKNQILKDPNINLKEDEVEWLVKHENVRVTDIPKRICVSKFLVNVQVEPEVVSGDVKAQNFEEVLDVKRGLEKFFEENIYGVLTAKGLDVAVWRGQRMYYMFDGLKRGPNGIQSSIGTACITRYLDLEKLADVFLQNLPVFGKNKFTVHKVVLSRDLCPREREPKEIIPIPKTVPKSAGLKAVVPGKSIIRGTISQEDPRFGKGPNVMSAPIAIVALTMSLIHKPESWSKPIVDDILILGAELYEDSVNSLSFDFNPWEDTLDIYKVNNDFKIGVVKANCELRNTDQRGYIDVKDPNVKNLRQGLESFFEENTHGILVTEPLTLAVWEEKQDQGNPLIFVFDPSPRSATGMPLFTGTACVVSFVNAKMASDHIIGCILDPSKRAGEFIIVPVEIVVGSARTVRKIEKTPTKSSINILPRCSKLVASEQKKKLRKLAEEDRKRKEAKKLQMIGRNGYHVMKGGEAILRGYKSQNIESYSPESRNNQDIPNCLASVVMHSLLSIEDWNYRHIDLLLDTGNQLYIDSYIAYGPKDPKLGMENVVRKFFMGNIEVHVTVYKPIISDLFTPNKVNSILDSFFQQEPFCILSTQNQWISLFFKAGFYYMFDPHERDIEGNLVKQGKSGTAVVLRFENLSSMALKIIQNLGENSEDTDTFLLWLVSVETK